MDLKSKSRTLIAAFYEMALTLRQYSTYWYHVMKQSENVDLLIYIR
jgi:hypothetical protein